MSRLANSSFNVDTWDERPGEEGAAAGVGRVRLTKTFRGDLEGTSTVEMLAVQGEVETSRAYVALERVAGRLEGREGGFVLMHSAIAEGGDASATLTVAPDTGTGELAGLRGSAQIKIEDGQHFLSLEYELPPG